MDELWKEGFDQKGANHFNHKVQGQKSKIDAMEVPSVLTCMSIDSVVVQFVAYLESRSKLGNFVLAYFNRHMGCGCCHQCILRQSSIKNRCKRDYYCRFQ